LTQDFVSTATALGMQVAVEAIDRARWDRPGLRGSCDYEGGFNWVHTQWAACPAAAPLAAAHLPWPPCAA